MTFAELLEEVMENTRGTQGGEQLQRAEAKRLMNLAMNEISLRVGVPTMYIDVPASGFVTGRFALPNRFHPEGVKYVEVVEVQEGSANVSSEWMKNRKLALLSVAEANEFHPNWEDDEYIGPAFMLYNPFQQNEGFLPVGITSARYRFLVHAVPDPMTENQHEPFATLDYCVDPPARSVGAMPNFHRILAHHVSYELLQRAGDQRWQAFYARYKAMEDEMFSTGTQAQVFLPQYRTSRRVRRYA